VKPLSVVLKLHCTLGSPEELVIHTDARILPTAADVIDLGWALPVFSFAYPLMIGMFSRENAFVMATAFHLS
jgi:hypothetical protein